MQIVQLIRVLFIVRVMLNGKYRIVDLQVPKARLVPQLEKPVLSNPPLARCMLLLL
jgi:hypothetical protein